MIPADIAWIVLSILVAALFGFVNTADRFIVDRFEFKPELIAVLVSLTGIFPAVIIFFYGVKTPELPIIMSSMFVGALFVLFVYFYFSALYNAATEVVIATLQSVVIFSLAWGYIFFNETFNCFVYLGIGLILVGILSLCLYRSYSYEEKNRSIYKALMYAMGASIILSLGLAVQKVNVKYADPLAIFFWGRVGNLVVIIMVLIFSKSIRIRLAQFFRSHRVNSTFFFALEMLYFFTIILRIFAVSKGPLTVVATFVSAQPMFVTLYSFILEKLGYSEPYFRKQSVFWRLFLVGIVVAGASIIAWKVESKKSGVQPAATGNEQKLRYMLPG